MNKSQMKSINRRDLFTEIMEGIQAMKEHRTGKITLRTRKVAKK